MGHGRRDGMRARRAWTAAATLAGVMLAGGAAPAGAQTPACRDCEVGYEARQRVEMRALEQQAVRLARQLAALAERYEADETVHRALRDASEALMSSNKLESADVARELAKAQRTIGARAHAVESDPQLARLVEQLAALETRAAFSTYVQSPAPAGWLGVTYQGEQEQKTKNGELLVHHYDYPAIISVTPWSPAAKAGIRAGDTLLAYNDQDVKRGALSLTKLLRPGETVTLRVRRNGTVREVPVKVERRETRIARVWTTPEAPAPPRSPSPAIRVMPLPPTEPGRVTAPPAPEPAVYSYSYSNSTSMIAGAELTPMNADLRDVFGTERGVLVLRVAVGTPAAEAGLRGGDVIVRAGGEPVTSTRVLSAQLHSASRERELELEIVRKKRSKTVMLRW